MSASSLPKWIFNESVLKNPNSEYSLSLSLSLYLVAARNLTPLSFPARGNSSGQSTREKYARSPKEREKEKEKPTRKPIEDPIQISRSFFRAI